MTVSDSFPASRVLLATLAIAVPAGCLRPLPWGDGSKPADASNPDTIPTDGPPPDLPPPDKPPPDKPPAGCASDGDCRKGELCLAGACRPGDCRKDGDCKVGHVCTANRCVCMPGRTECSGECRDLATDGENCGSCGRACGDKEQCVAGTCRKVECVADKDCTDSRMCTGGLCSCKPGLATCFTQCVDVRNDPWNCGSCGHVCWKYEQCIDGTCTDPGTCLTDVECPPTYRCAVGACVCPEPLGVCGTECVDVRSDPRHCFNCSTSCKPGNLCVMGMCVAKKTCGSSSDCPKGHTCTGGACTCGAGLIDCGANGCSDLKTDAQNCGSCGITCADPALCVDGRCARKKGDVLEEWPLPTPGDPLVGMSAFTNHDFWATSLSGRIFKFDVLLNSVYSMVDNPDKSGKTRPHGVALLGRELFFGLYPADSKDGPSAKEDLGLIYFGGIGGGGFATVVPGEGAAFAPASDRTLYAYSNATKKLMLQDSTPTTTSSVTVTGLDAAEVVWDLAFDGKEVWVVGLRYAGGSPTAGFVKTVDPGSGKVTATLKSPDPAWATATTYDGANIWIAGKTKLYRCQP